MRLLFALLLCAQICNSQTACFDIVLSGYNVSSVTDDNQFIWLGTYNNGLISYDKITEDFQIYTTSNSTISSNSIKSVLNINGRLYVSTDLSLMQLSNDNFQEISTTIQGVMTTTPNDNLAIAAQYEFNILNASNQIIYTQDLQTLVTPSCCGMTTSMDYDDNGNLWLSNYAFYEYDILTFDGINWNVYDVTNSILPIESFNFLNGITAHSDIVYATNWYGLLKFENDNWLIEHNENTPTIFNDMDNISGLVANAVKFDSQGYLWIGAGEPENTGDGKIAFKGQNDWQFLDNNSQMLPGVNLFEESQYDSETIYAASNDGLIIINTSCLSLSTNDYEYDSNAVTMYPNPTTGILNITFKNNKPFAFQLINSLGQVVLSKANFLNQTIDLSTYASGVYTLLIQLEDKIINTKILKFNK